MKSLEQLAADYPESLNSAYKEWPVKSLEQLAVEYPESLNSAYIAIPKEWEGVIVILLNSFCSWMWYNKAHEAGVRDLDYIKILEIKEKFGGLRVYYTVHGNPTDYKGRDVTQAIRDRTDGAITLAERLIWHIRVDADGKPVIDLPTT